MFNFDSALKDSLHIASERLKQVDTDLQRVTGTVAASLNAASGEAIRLKLVDREVDSAQIYKLTVEHRGADHYGDDYLTPVAAFRVTVKGYPVEAGRYNDYEFKPEKELENAAALEAFFAEMVSSADSPLVFRAATLMALHERRKKEEEERDVKLEAACKNGCSITEHNVPF